MPVTFATKAFGFLLWYASNAIISALILLPNPARGNTVAGDSESPSETLGGGLCVIGNYLYVAAWGYGLQVLDISTPTQPKWAGAWNHRGAPTGVQVVGSHAYVANRPCGLEVLNVQNPRSPVGVANLRTGGDAMGVLVNGRYVYLADGVLGKNGSYLPRGSEGLKVVDISSPSNPQLVSGYERTAEAQDVPVIGDIFHLGRIVYVNDGQSSAITALHRERMISEMSGFYIFGNRAYVANRGALEVFDITKPNDPVELGVYKTTYGAWDVRVSGKYAYLMDTGAGIHIMDISDPTNLREVGQFACNGYVSRWIALQPPVQSEIAYNPTKTSDALPDEIQPIDTAPPELINPHQSTNGTFTFTLVGVSNARYLIQFSDNWSNWTTLGISSLPANGFATITDPRAGEAAQRYYRAVRQ